MVTLGQLLSRASKSSGTGNAIKRAIKRHGEDAQCFTVRSSITLSKNSTMARACKTLGAAHYDFFIGNTLKTGVRAQYEMVVVPMFIRKG